MSKLPFLKEFHLYQHGKPLNFDLSLIEHNHDTNPNIKPFIKGKRTLLFTHPKLKTTPIRLKKDLNKSLHNHLENFDSILESNNRFTQENTRTPLNKRIRDRINTIYTKSLELEEILKEEK